MPRCPPSTFPTVGCGGLESTRQGANLATEWIVMIIQCQSRAAKYFLSEENMPANPLKVRCPKCRAVFLLAPRSERVAVGAGVGTPAPHAVPAAQHAAPME